MQTERPSTPSKYTIKVRREFVRLERRGIPDFLRVRSDARDDDDRTLRLTRRNTVVA